MHDGRHNSGFTLVELLVYLGVISFVLLAVASFAFEFATSSLKSSVIEEVNRNARFAMSRVAQEIRESSDVNTGSSTFGSNPGTLSLATASGGTNPTIINVASGALDIQQGAGAVLPLTSSKVSVTNFTVENLAVAGKTKEIRVTLTLTSVGTGQSSVSTTTTLTTTVRVHKNDGYSN